MKNNRVWHLVNIGGSSFAVRLGVACAMDFEQPRNVRLLAAKASMGQNMTAQWADDKF